MKQWRVRLPKAFRFLASLPFAIVVMAALAGLLAVGTWIESARGTVAAQYYVFRSPILYGLLFLFGTNIAAVAVSRWPWRRMHVPFLLAHLGILAILGGAFVSEFYGLEGEMELRSDSRLDRVTLDQSVLNVRKDGVISAYPIPRLPRGAAFTQRLGDSGFTVLQYFAQPIREEALLLNTGRALATQVEPAPALELEWVSERVRVKSKITLWAGDEARATFSEGPLQIRLLSDREDASPSPVKNADLPIAAFVDIRVKNAGFDFHFRDNRGRDEHRWYSRANSEPFATGWMDFKLRIVSFSEDARLTESFRESTEWLPDEAKILPVLKMRDPRGLEFYLRLGQSYRSSPDEGVHYSRREVRLPFALELLKFRADFDHAGTLPARFSSIVNVHHAERSELRSLEMNRPLDVGDYTFYQSGYRELATEHPVSILSVNRDPGRTLKYGGALLLILGSVLLFLRNRSRKIP